MGTPQHWQGPVAGWCRRTSAAWSPPLVRVYLCAVHWSLLLRLHPLRAKPQNFRTNAKRSCNRHTSQTSIIPIKRLPVCERVSCSCAPRSTFTTKSSDCTPFCDASLRNPRVSRLHSPLHLSYARHPCSSSTGGLAVAYLSRVFGLPESASIR